MKDTAILQSTFAGTKEFAVYIATCKGPRKQTHHLDLQCLTLVHVLSVLDIHLDDARANGSRRHNHD